LNVKRGEAPLVFLGVIFVFLNLKKKTIFIVSLNLSSLSSAHEGKTLVLHSVSNSNAVDRMQKLLLRRIRILRQHDRSS